MRHQSTPRQPLHGVRKPCCIRTRACPIRVLHGEYSCDGCCWGWGGKSLGGGWHFLHLVLTIPDNAGVQSREPLRVLGGGQPTIPRDP